MIWDCAYVLPVMFSTASRHHYDYFAGRQSAINSRSRAKYPSPDVYRSPRQLRRCDYFNDHPRNSFTCVLAVAAKYCALTRLESMPSRRGHSCQIEAAHLLAYNTVNTTLKAQLVIHHQLLLSCLGVCRVMMVTPISLTEHNKEHIVHRRSTSCVVS
nr:hypothetical protein CFP56_67357 [Quercus suber]